VIPILTPVLAFFATWLAWRLLGEVQEHTVYLFGRVTARDRGEVQIRIALQNGEDVALRSEPGGRWRIEFEVEPEGSFSSRPDAYLGPRRAVGYWSKDQSIVRLDFEELPPSDTWVFDCRVDVHVRALTLKLYEINKEGHQVVRRLRRISESSLRIEARHDAVVVRGPETLPSWRFGFAGIALALTIYVMLVQMISSRDAAALIHPFSSLPDIPLMAAIALCGVALLRLVQRPAPAVIQGYQRASDIEWRDLAPGGL
jgi:hypothetical protein